MPKNAFRLMNMPWKTPAGSFCLNELFKYTSDYEIDWDLSPAQMVNDMMAKAPQIQIQKDNGTYELYFWVKNAWFDDGSEDGLDIEGWCNQSGALVVPDNPAVEESDGLGNVVPGVAAWFKDPANDEPAVQFAGAVLTEDTVINCPADYRLRATTIPAAINVNEKDKILFTGLYNQYEIDWDLSPAQMVNDMMANAPQIQVQKLNSETYELYFYVKNAWFDDGSEDGLDIEGWCNQSGALVVADNPAVEESDGTGVIPVGAGMWFKGCKNAFTAKFFGLK